MNILTEYSFLSDRQIETIENRHCPKCMSESQLKLRSDKWGDLSSAVLYAAKPHPEGSNWYGIRDNAVQFVISNATSAVEEPFFGVLAENDDVIYSRHRHDFRESGDKTAFIDRGRGRPRSYS